MSSLALLQSAPIPKEVRAVLERLSSRGFGTYLVGGCVRDLLRGVTPKDWDVATAATPDQVQKSFGKVIPTGIQHGTVTVLSMGHPVEVTTFRVEGAYVDGRRPESVEFRTDVVEDLSRRDFTFNAMAFDPLSGELVDPFDGQVDLQKQLIRCVGDPKERFGEDGLRPMRAVRFAAQLGFALDERTHAAIPPAIPVFRKVSGERVKEEFQKLLLSPRPQAGLQLLLETELLYAFLPEVAELNGFSHGTPRDLFELAASAVQQTPADIGLRLAALLAEVARPRTLVMGPDGPAFPDHERLGEQLAGSILTRLKFPNKVRDQVVLLVREHAVPISAPWSDAQIRRFAARVGQANLSPLLTVMRAQRTVWAEPERLEQLAIFESRIESVLASAPPLAPAALALNGESIMRVLGIGPSPLVGEATRYLMDRVFEDPTLNAPLKLTAALTEWGSQRGLPPAIKGS